MHWFTTLMTGAIDASYIVSTTVAESGCCLWKSVTHQAVSLKAQELSKITPFVNHSSSFWLTIIRQTLILADRMDIALHKI